MSLCATDGKTFERCHTGTAMRILSYNIRLGLDSSLDRIAEVIRILEADVVCLQEVGRFWQMGEPVDTRAVLAVLTDLPHALFVPAIQRGAAQFGIALLSRYPAVVVDRRTLPRNRDEPRALLLCELSTPGGEVMLVTSHISVDPNDRPGQLRAVTQRVLTRWGRRRLPTVVAGDLNAPIEEPALRQCMGWLGLRSALHAALEVVPPTYPTRDPAIGIDHILVSREVGVAGAGVAELSGSDHLPIWADLRIGV